MDIMCFRLVSFASPDMSSLSLSNQVLTDSFPIQQVLVLSILTPVQVRVLQAHYDGTLHIARSKLYNFNVRDHQEIMDLLIRWMMPRPVGDTTSPKRRLPTIPDSFENWEDLEENAREAEE